MSYKYSCKWPFSMEFPEHIFPVYNACTVSICVHDTVEAAFLMHSSSKISEKIIKMNDDVGMVVCRYK